MAGKSDYYEGIAIRLIMGASFSFTPPASVYIGLYSVAPTDAGGGTQLTGSGYARVAVANNMTQWPWSGGKKANATQIDFPLATANWLPAVAAGIFDSATAGNLLFWVPISPSLVAFNGSRLSIPVNGLQLTES